MDVLATHRFQVDTGGTTTWDALTGAAGTVLVTLDPECPFCQGYAPVIDSLARASSSHGIRFTGVYCSAYIRPDSAMRFAEEAGFDFPQVMDPDCRIANALHARVTPECFLLDAQGSLIYHGAIDDWAVRAGRHRAAPTQHYLADALEALVAKRSPGIPHAQARGCIVECADPQVHE